MLALTFTRLAGAEMKRRIIKSIGEAEGSKIFCNTFHAFAVKMLRDYGYKIGVDNDFTIYDDEDREAIFSRIIDSANFKITLPKALKVYARPSAEAELETYERLSYRTIESEYNSRLINNNAIDLSMLIKKMNSMLRSCPEIPTELRRRYKYVFVDEFQDTSTGQSEFLRILEPENLFIVGDDYQSIYEWRDAQPEQIINIAEGSPENGYEVIRLETNYRSTGAILSIANEIIKKNVRRTEKTLVPYIEGSGIDNSVMIYNTMGDELMNICNEIKTDIERDTAILCRTNNQVDTISEFLSQEGIKALTISKKNHVLKKHHIRELIRALQLSVNNNDDHALLMTINAWGNYASPETLRNAKLKSTQQEIPILQILRNEERSRKFVEVIEKLRLEDSAAEAMNELIDGMKIRELNDMIGLDNRNEDMRDLLQLMNRWEGRQLQLCESVSIEAFMIWVMLHDIQSSIEEGDLTPVKIMTIHSAKGLEFDRVFIPQVNKGTFPTIRGDLEEERRLFFVAVTRAENELHISCAREKMSFYNRTTEQEPSSFFLISESACKRNSGGI